MNYDAARLYLLARPEAREDFPFGPDTAVMKIGGKMFATLSRTDGAASMNLKCDPDEAVMLRDIFDAVRPGYHMNKEHWNTVVLDGSVPDQLVRDWVETSWRLVAQGLRKSDRVRLGLA